jgi:D-beta-D-heptose 7-phosphate kinase/D-beta-D-heptose 1-phosphate adenosyltransferase
MAENIASRVISRDELKKTVANCRLQNKKIVATNGCFDILHIGHLHLLSQAKALGDILIVGINTDRSVSKLKGPERPVVNESERAAVIANLRMVDFVTIFDEDTAIELLKAIEPDVYVKGGDYNSETLPEAAAVAAFGGTVKFVEFLPRKNSSSLIDKIKLLS